MHFPISIPALLVASVIVLLGAAIQGSVGFGLGSFAVPLLLLIDEVLVPGPVLALAFVLTILIYRRNRAEVVFSEVKWGIVGRLLGTAAGAVLLSVIAREYTAPLIAGMVLIALGFMLAGRRLKLTVFNLIGIAAISGFMGTVASIGGPPLALLYYDQSGSRIRGTLSGIFIVGAVAAIVSLSIIGRFGLPEILLWASLLPALLVGYSLSSFSARILDRGYLQPAILVISAGASLFILIRFLVLG
jgi:uncharacterized membrane protein YfcA